MKKFFCIIAVFVCICINPVYASVIKGGVSKSDEIPSELFGSWRVEAVLIKSTNEELFEARSTDIWMLERNGKTVTLSNPVSGARADIDVRDIKGRTVKFEKRSFYPDEESVETPVLTLHDDNFTGFDRINIKTFKDGKLIKEDYVEYKVRGVKISGASAKGIFGISGE